MNMMQVTREKSALSSYERYRPLMKTGDVIAFAGNGQFSQLIKWVTKSSFSHVGLVVKTELGGGFGQTVLLIESTILTDLPNFGGQTLIRGVQMHLLSQRLEVYNGSAWWVPLQKSLPLARRVAMEMWLRQTFTKKTPYDETQILGAALDVFDKVGWENKQEFSTLFCSELVTKALQVARAIDGNINPSEQTPQDVINFDCLTQPPVQIK